MAWEDLRASYDTVARAYEARFLDELHDKPRDRELLTSFAAAASDPVLEVGCGPGQIGAFVRDRGRRVVGIDLSAEMAGLASRRLDAALAGDVRSLPVADAQVGGVVAFYSVIHVQRAELGTVLEECGRVLRPGGRILLSAHEGQGIVERAEFLGEDVPFVATLFSLDELVEACRVVGLTVSHAERRDPYPAESTVRLHVEAVRPSRSP